MSVGDDVAMLGETPLGGGFMGPRPTPGYSLRVTTGAGDRIIIDGFGSLSVNRRHTAMSDWSATVPTPPDIGDRVLSSVRLSWGDTVLFRGRLEDVSGDLLAPTVDISGRGIEADLTRGDIDTDLANVRYHDAIRRIWRQHTEFTPAVVAPDDPGHPANARISTDEDDGDYSGTPMSVLKTLHEECGMRFTVLHSRPGRNVESYPAGARRRRHDWDVLGGDRDVSAKDYANRVTVTGALKPDGSGERVWAVAEDESEIETMRERGVGNDGRVTYPIQDDSISDPGKARATAQSELSKLVDKDDVGGSLDITPTIAAPGYQYWVGEFADDETIDGGYGAAAYGELPYGAGEMGQYVSLNKISYSISRGDASCTLDFSRREGFADALEAAHGGQT